MKLHNLTPAKGSVKSEKRVGRGPGSGLGKTAGRGSNGAKSRSGYARKIGFEGDQMPIQRRLPKFGFKNHNRIEYKAVNLAALQTISERFGVTAIDVDVIRSAGFASKTDLVKILGNGELTAKLDVTADAFSASAIKKIEEKGGTVTKL